MKCSFEAILAYKKGKSYFYKPNGFHGSFESSLETCTRYEDISQSQPRAIQIMDFDEKSSNQLGILFYKQELASIVRKTGNRPVAIIAIAGAKRQGKSLYLNFILRHLKNLEGTATCPDDEPLVGFTWKASHERVTRGMWMWSEPFTVRSKHDGSEVDILLVDTQGVFDQQTGEREWSILMGLSLLTSSCIIFNVMQNINENDLQILAKFLCFGKLAMQDERFSNAERPFQKLVYLVRDFGNPDEFPYGWEGGKRFIKNVLTPNAKCIPENNTVREMITECFHEISCILLPPPEREVLLKHYNGSAAASKEFTSEIQKSISHLLDHETIPTFKINGNHLTGEGFLELFETYVNLFNRPELVLPPSIYYATTQVCNAAVAKKCIDSFVNFIENQINEKGFLSDEDLKRSSDEAYKNSIHQFRSSSNLMGTQAAVNEAENNLLKQLYHEFENLKSLNTTKRIGAETTMNEAVKSTLEQYVKSMSSEIGNRTLAEDKVDKYHKKVLEKCMQEFSVLYSLSPLFPQSSSKLTGEIEKERLKFQQQMLTARESIDREIDQVLSLYRSQLEAVTSLEKLSIANDLARSTALESIQGSQNIPEKEKATYCLQLDSKLTKMHAEFLQHSLIHLNSVQLQASISKAIKTVKKEYKKFMTSCKNEDGDFLTVSQLEEAHILNLTEAKKYLKVLLQHEIDSQQISEESLKSIMDDLGENIQRCYAQVKENHAEREKEAHQNVIAHVQKCLQLYFVMMEAHLKGKLLSHQVILEGHEDASKRCLEEFKQINCNSALFKREQQRLAEQIKTKLEKLLNDMATQIEKHNEVARAQSATAESIYISEMMKLTEEETIQQFHSLHKMKALESLQTFKNQLNEEFIDQLTSNLDERIEKVYEDMLSSIGVEKTQLIDSIEEAQKKGVALYTENMTLFFHESDEYYPEEVLSDRHNHELTEAKKVVKVFCNEIGEKTKALGEEYQEFQILLKVSKDINRVFAQFREQNNERKKAVEQQIEGQVQTKVDLYKTVMDSRMKAGVLSQDQLIKEHSEVQQQCVDKFTNENSTIPLFSLGKESLLSQTNQVYTNYLRMVIESEIKKAKEDASKIYQVYADEVLPKLDGSPSSERLLEEQHNEKKAAALTHFENAYQNIARNSIDTSAEKKSNQVELTAIIEAQYRNLVESNKTKRDHANALLKEQVGLYTQKYETAMTAEIKTGILLQDQIHEAHQKIRSTCLNEFAENNKTSIFVVHGREILLKKIDEKGDNFKREIKDRVESLKEKGRQLVADGISTYRFSMSEVALGDITAFNTTNDVTQRFVLRSIDKAGDIPEESLKAELRRSLKSEMQTIHEQLIAKRLQSKEEIEKGAAKAREDAQAQYHDNIKKRLSTISGYIEDSELQTWHKVEQERAENSFKNFFLNLPAQSEIAKEEERKGLVKLNKSISEIYRRFQGTNKSNQVQLEKRMNDDVKRLSKEYTTRMESTFGQEIVVGTKFKTIHDCTFAAIMNKFSRDHSSCIIFNKGQNDLISKINEKKYQLENKMTTYKAEMDEIGGSLVAQGLAAYSQEMSNASKMFGTEALESEHAKNKELQLELISSSDLITSENYKDNIISQLRSAIDDKYVELVGLHSNNDPKVTEVALKARQEAKNEYKKKMKALFNRAGNPIQESTLIEEHNLARSKAIASLTKARVGWMSGNLNNYEAVKEAAVNGLKEHLDKEYRKLQDKNNLLFMAFEAKGGNLSSIKAEYAKKLGEIQAGATDKEELDTRDAALRLQIETAMAEWVGESFENQEFLEKLREELKDYMAMQYNQTFEEFSLRLTKDKIAVAAAIQSVSQVYTQEMDKVFLTKSFFKPFELLQQSDGIAETAITKYKKEAGELSQKQKKTLKEALQKCYQKYHDKNLMQYPCKNAAIGIDLGTTYSCVAVYLNGEVTIIPNREFNQSPITASYVSFRDDHTIAVGDPAKEQASRYPVDTIFDAKRLIGRSYKDEIVQNDIKLWPFVVVDDFGQPKIKVQGKVYHPEEISARLLAKMKANAEAFLNQPVTQAVVTVPAYFTDAQRQATKDAAQIAGLTATRILNEPTAAAIAYSLHHKDEIRERNVLIFDLGGGTFDVAVLHMKGNDIKVKAIGGDTHLGGEDFDNRMVEEMIRRVKEKHGIDLARGRDSDDPSERARASQRLRLLRDPCEKAKKFLSSLTSYDIYVDRLDGDFRLEEKITREEFETLNKDLFEKCIEIVKTAVDEARIDKDKIDDIVLVGGSTRIPKVQQLLKEFFDGKIFCTSINPDEAVARGAAIQAAVINGEQAAKLGDGFKLSDVTPLPIGVEVANGNMSVIIEKNTSVPCHSVERYQTFSNNQTSVDVKIYEGEDPVAAKNNRLGEFEVNGIPKNKAGAEKIDCTMTIDEEGILSVKATSCSTGNEEAITINTHKGRMSRSQIRIAKEQHLFKWSS